jgi:16S rRNA (guanine527-N7)-methyltransferase
VRLGAILADGLRALGLDVGAATQARLLDYLELLTKWNRTYNLTAIREPERMVTHHLLDSLAVLPHFPKAPALSVLDVGSGAGLPGIPIALARPHWRLVLLDRSGKKAAFLRQAASELALANIDVVAMRVEDYRPALRFDAAIARAYADLATFVETTSRLVTASGRVLAMKGAYPEEELQRVASHIHVLGVPKLEVPGLDAERHLVIMAPEPA